MTTESDRSHVLEACPNKAQHTPQPDGYLEWHDWAERMTCPHRLLLAWWHWHAAASRRSMPGRVMVGGEA